MRTEENIIEEISAEQRYINKLCYQIEKHKKIIKQLETDRQNAEKEKLNIYIDNWLNDKFGIKNQEEARRKSIFIVFDRDANFIKTVICGYGEEFHYVTPAEDKDTLEYWLKKNKLYAQRASSFCDRNYKWYNISFKEQLENLCWKFDKNGRVSGGQW